MTLKCVTRVVLFLYQRVVRSSIGTCGSSWLSCCVHVTSLQNGRARLASLFIGVCTFPNLLDLFSPRAVLVCESNPVKWRSITAFHSLMIEGCRELVNWRLRKKGNFWLCCVYKDLFSHPELYLCHINPQRPQREVVGFSEGCSNEQFKKTHDGYWCVSLLCCVTSGLQIQYRICLCLSVPQWTEKWYLIKFAKRNERQRPTCRSRGGDFIVVFIPQLASILQRPFDLCPHWPRQARQRTFRCTRHLALNQRVESMNISSRTLSLRWATSAPGEIEVHDEYTTNRVS